MSEEPGSVTRDAGALAARAAPPMRRSIAPLVLLIGITALLYAPAAQFDFIHFDDPQYLFENPSLQRGITRDTAWWALTSLDGNSWRPVANLVHLLAFTAFGPDPGAQHVVSVAIFVVTTAALFAVFRAATGSALLAFVAAALWAWHPLRVENVCWLTETAGPIAGLFCVAALGAYVAYARRGGAARYALVTVCFVLAMMAKPTLPALPIALLALDLWPLGRAEAAWISRRWRGVGWLVLEKMPLLAIALAFTVFTAIQVASVTDQQSTAPATAWTKALLAVPAAYVWTLLKTAWPVDLSVHYPWAMSWSRGQSILALLGLCALTILIVRSRSKPLLAGWFWFLVMLLPMLVASRYRSSWVADRYVYLPHMLLMAGIAAAILDATAARSTRPASTRETTAAAGRHSSKFLQRWGVLGTAMAALIILSAQQVWRWQNSETLFRHSLDIAPESDILRYNFGVVLHRQERFPEATEQYAQAIKISPAYVDPRVNLGIVAERLGDYAQAERHLRVALQIEPTNRAARFAFARLRAQQGRHHEAANMYEQLTREYPDDLDVHVNLGAALEAVGDRAAAEAHYREALRIDPNDPDALSNLNRLLAGGAGATPAGP